MNENRRCDAHVLRCRHALQPPAPKLRTPGTSQHGQQGRSLTTEDREAVLCKVQMHVLHRSNEDRMPDVDSQPASRTTDRTVKRTALQSSLQVLRHTNPAADDRAQRLCKLIPADLSTIIDNRRSRGWSGWRTEVSEGLATPCLLFRKPRQGLRCKCYGAIWATSVAHPLQGARCSAS